VAKMSSRDQLLLWIGDDPLGLRANLAAWAEQAVSDIHASVEPGSEQFYALVLAEVLRPGK